MAYAGIDYGLGWSWDDIQGKESGKTVVKFNSRRELNMKAIMTKYHGASNVRGSRISASDSDNNRVVLSYDHALNSDGNHEIAAYALRDKMGWKGRLIGGGWKMGTQVWVFVPDAS